MSAFYKMDPSAWDFGTADLSLEQEAAYLRIVNAIHKHDAPVPDNDRILAGLFRTSTRKARALVSALVEAGKLTIEDGKIWNERARSDMVQRGFVTISRAESGAKGGRTRALNAANQLKEKDKAQAIASSRIEENRIEKEETKVSSKKRASRLPADWRLPKAWGEWAVAEGMDDVCVRREADKFADYWHSASGKTATKIDWEAVWRNWIRKAIDDRKSKARTRPEASADSFGAFGHIPEFR